MERHQLLKPSREVFIARTEVCKMAREEEFEERDGNILRLEESLARDEVFIASLEEKLEAADPL